MDYVKKKQKLTYKQMGGHGGNKKVNSQLEGAFLVSVWVSFRCFGVAYNEKHVF